MTKAFTFPETEADLTALFQDLNERRKLDEAGTVRKAWDEWFRRFMRSLSDSWGFQSPPKGGVLLFLVDSHDKPVLAEELLHPDTDRSKLLRVHRTLRIIPFADTKQAVCPACHTEHRVLLCFEYEQPALAYAIYRKSMTMLCLETRRLLRLKQWTSHSSPWEF